MANLNLITDIRHYVPNFVKLRYSHIKYNKHCASILLPAGRSENDVIDDIAGKRQIHVSRRGQNRTEFVDDSRMGKRRGHWKEND
jgi:hypothetical protein